MENKIKSAEWNNTFHTLAMYKECKCGATMRLEAKELHQQVSYYYICTFTAVYSKCGNTEEVK